MEQKTLIGIGITALLVIALGLQGVVIVHAVMETIVINGYVKDTVGNPIEGAYVEWINADATEIGNYTTGADGKYGMSEMYEEHVSFTSRITATKRCYLPNSTELLTESSIPGPGFLPYENVNITLKEDDIGPNIQFVSPTPKNESKIAVNYVNVTVNVTDPSKVSMVRLNWNGNNETMHNGAPDIWSFNVTDLPKDSEHTYKVYANDTCDNWGVSDTRVVTANVTKYRLNVTLEPGWNMIGVPLNLSNYTLPEPLESIGGNYTRVIYYNATSEEYEYYPPYTGVPRLEKLEPGAGYWIHMTARCNLTFEGEKFVEPSRDLESGWNMFSVPYGIANNTLPRALESIEDNYTRVIYYNATSEEYEYYPPYTGVPRLEKLEPGAGYWIHMAESATFIPSMGE